MNTQHTPGWINVSDRLPEKYCDVLIRIDRDGETEQRVGRLNHYGRWQLSSYQHCKHQYMCEPEAWFDEKVVIAANAELLESLQEVVKLANQAHDHWDSDHDAKVGKILLALSGHLPRYDKRIDAIHAAIAKATGAV